jgi:hypothetical protein
MSQVHEKDSSQKEWIRDERYEYVEASSCGSLLGGDLHHHVASINISIATVLLSFHPQLAI